MAFRSTLQMRTLMKNGEKRNLAPDAEADEVPLELGSSALGTTTTDTSTGAMEGRTTGEVLEARKDSTTG